MNLEIIPWRFRNIVSPKEFEEKPAKKYGVSGANDLYNLYMDGIPFRIVPDSPMDAIALKFGELSESEANSLDRIQLSYMITARAPEAVLKIPGMEYSRMVLYGLEDTYSPEYYPILYAKAFSRILALSGIRFDGNLPMPIPGQWICGLPYPDLPYPEMDAVPGLRPTSMPLSYNEAKALFGIDDTVSMPAAEYFNNTPIPAEEWNRHIWQGIIPAAFSWLHYFSHTEEPRWNLNRTNFTFLDCISAISRAMRGLGMVSSDIWPLPIERLEKAYNEFAPGPLKEYACRKIDPKTAKMQREARWKRGQWQRRTPEERRMIYERHNMRLRGITPPPVPIGRKPKYPIHSLEDLEKLKDSGKISIPYYYQKKRELKAAMKKKPQ